MFSPRRCSHSAGERPPEPKLAAWPFPILTINYGVRYDQYQAYSSGNQISPRVNAVLTAFEQFIAQLSVDGVDGIHFSLEKNR
jgi:hypothetical protein